MKVITKYINFSTKGNADIKDITGEIQQSLRETKLKRGNVTIFVIGSTAALTTVEYEPGLVQDLKDFFERVIPQDYPYQHHLKWHDGNGHSHVRASLIGPSLTIPFDDGSLIMGTWQQIIFIDFDNRRRDRKVVLNFIGE